MISRTRKRDRKSRVVRKISLPRCETREVAARNRRKSRELVPPFVREFATEERISVGDGIERQRIFFIFHGTNVNVETYDGKLDGKIVLLFRNIFQCGLKIHTLYAR